jgi:hypothetical protein
MYTMKYWTDRIEFSNFMYVLCIVLCVKYIKYGCYIDEEVLD